MAATHCNAWRRLESRHEFVEAFADKPLVDEGIRFTITSDGRISGTVDGLQFSGHWHWSNGYFCRTVHLDGEDLGQDCELIEQRGTQMRYTRNHGSGEASIVEIDVSQTGLNRSV